METLVGDFIPGPKGPIFVQLRRPKSAASDCVVVVPPFAEEMNKCRRMMTETAIVLAESGIATVIPDLYGTGDSAGDFADGDWGYWQQDLGAAVNWAAMQGYVPSGILAIRLGAALALAAQASGEVPSVEKTVLWQPVFDGGRFLAQFLRLRTAASLMEDRKESVAELRTRLRAGESVEVAGYTLSGRLADQLEVSAIPEHLPTTLGETVWLEIVRDVESELPAPSQKLIDATRSGGGVLHVTGIVGEPFWSSTEIVVNRAFISRTGSHFNRRVRASGQPDA